MKNYDPQYLSELKKKTTSFRKELSLASAWVSKNLSHEERLSLLRLVKETKSEVFSIDESVDTKPVFALFGQSQVGKSYLVKNLLTTDGKGFEIEFPNEEKYDFLQTINPRGGGAESTGVVTRFSIDAPIISQDHPVKVSLLDAKDIILILCDGFFSDLVKIENYPSAIEFEKHIHEFKATSVSPALVQSFLTEEHIYIIKKYFEHYFVRNTHYVNAISSSDFWLNVSGFIEQVEPSNWVRLFEILWGYNPTFSKLFQKLIDGLVVFGFSRIIYVKSDAVLRDKGKILDVDRVKGIFGVPESTKVLTSDKRLVDIDLHLLSALVSEITMPLNSSIAETKKFLHQTDLLDFPGARSRKQLKPENINDTSIPEILLRGKISYLFNKYSSNYEINNLLFCLKNEKNEVSEIPQLLNDWIERNVGLNDKDREERIGKSGINPLFIVLTFYNKSLEFNPHSDQGELSGKWNNRFIKFFKDETVTTRFNWDDNWTTSQPDFKGFYLLRDFEFSDDVFEGFNTEGRETGIVPERREYMERMKSSFLAFPYVKKHFDDPLDAWESSSTLNRDGSERIINDLLPSANNQIKTRNYLGRLTGYQTSVLKSLKKHFHADEIQQLRKQASDEGGRIRDKLLQLFGADGSKFGEFLSKLYISTTDAYNYIHENYLPASKDHVPSREEVFLRTYGIHLELSIDDNKKLLQEKLGLSSQEEVDTWLSTQQVDLKKVLQNVHVTAASKLVEGVIEIWKQRIDVKNFKSFEKGGLDSSTVRLIADNLLNTFELFGIRQELIRIFEKKTRLMRVSNDTHEYLSSLISSYINDFVSNFGFNFMMDERRQQVLALAHDYRIDTSLVTDIQAPLTENDLQNLFEEDDSSNDLPVTFPVVDHYKSFITKIQLILLSNCGFRNFDIAENERLREIISNIESIDFKL